MYALCDTDVVVKSVAMPTQAELGEDGLHKQKWFSLTFKDIAEDISDAADEGKRLVVLFEQKGCIYCAKLHEKLLSDPEISDYIQSHFNVVQMNMFGDEEVTDLDGEVFSEKGAVKKWGVNFTPLFLFMPETAASDTDAGKAAVASLPGAFGKLTFLHMFKWVSEKATRVVSISRNTTPGLWQNARPTVNQWMSEKIVKTGCDFRYMSPYTSDKT